MLSPSPGGFPTYASPKFQERAKPTPHLQLQEGAVTIDPSHLRKGASSTTSPPLQEGAKRTFPAAPEEGQDHTSLPAPGKGPNLRLIFICRREPWSYLPSSSSRESCLCLFPAPRWFTANASHKIRE